MTATKNPDVAPPANPPIRTLEWVLGSGISDVQEWQGERTEMETAFNNLVSQGEAGGNIAQATLTEQNGRCRLVARLGRNNAVSTPGAPPGVQVIEELYAVDVIKDVREAPYFTTGANALTDDQILWVSLCLDERWSVAEVTAEAGTNDDRKYANWTAGMRDLRYHMAHGQESYYETGFILRKSSHGIRTSGVGASFTDINRVVTAPVFTSAMNHLIAALPAGEWLYRPPQASYLGRGRWRVDQEWQWAQKWSKIYGGTWGL